MSLLSVNIKNRNNKVAEGSLWSILNCKALFWSSPTLRELFRKNPLNIITTSFSFTIQLGFITVMPSFTWWTIADSRDDLKAVPRNDSSRGKNINYLQATGYRWLCKVRERQKISRFEDVFYGSKREGSFVWLEKRGSRYGRFGADLYRRLAMLGWDTMWRACGLG